MIWVFALLFYIFYLFDANVTRKTCSIQSPPSQAKNNHTVITIKKNKQKKTFTPKEFPDVLS